MVWRLAEAGLDFTGLTRKPETYCAFMAHPQGVTFETFGRVLRLLKVWESAIGKHPTSARSTQVVWRCVRAGLDFTGL